MKKYFVLLLLAFVTTAIYAQGNKNRLVVVDKAGNYKGVVIEQIDSMFFDNVVGNVAVNVTYHDIDANDTLPPAPLVSFSLSEACAKYRYDVMLKSAADELKDVYMVAQYFDNVRGSYLYDETTKARIECPSLEKGKMYTIVALGYDKYNTPGDFAKVDFMIPGDNASVKCDVLELATDSVSVKITPNDLCSGYYVWLFAEGDAESTWSQWAANLQWKTEGDMVKYLGKDFLKGVNVKTWKDLKPGSNYELYVQACNENNEYGELIKLPIKTAQIGGDGLAEMTIEVGEYGFDTQDRNKVYWQQVIFRPNDQCAAHRDIVLSEDQFKSTYAGDENKLIEYMKNEKNPSFPPFLDDPNWNQYGIHDYKVYIEHETKYVAFSMSKNAKGEWGPLAKAEFTTPKKPKF